eukprot:2369405-Pyramimonas_sp.AAC.1
MLTSARFLHVCLIIACLFDYCVCSILPSVRSSRLFDSHVCSILASVPHLRGRLEKALRGCARDPHVRVRPPLEPDGRIPPLPLPLCA